MMILIALGANLSGPSGDAPEQTCRSALATLKHLDEIAFVAASPWYRTRPVPRDDRQPDYCNGVACFEGQPDPAALLEALHRIEASFGRVRSVANAARVLDLDLVDLNGMVRAGPPPILPHPRAHLRSFVLRPLLDVAPDWVHPALNITGRRLFADLPQDGAEAIEPW